MSHFTRKRRAAFTLIEIMATVTLSSVLLSGVAVTIISLQRATKLLREDAPWGVQRARLAIQWRSDVHAATAVMVVAATDSAPAKVRLSHGEDTVVEYQAAGSTLTRHRAGEPPGPDQSFELPVNSTVEWQLEDERLVTMVVRQTRAKGPQPARGRVLRLSAARGTQVIP